MCFKFLKYFLIVGIILTSFLCLLEYIYFQSSYLEYDDYDENFELMELNEEDQGFNVHYINNLKKIRETYLEEDNLGKEYFINQKIDASIPLIIWWTPFTMDIGSYKKCGQSKELTCFFTNSRKYKNFTNGANKAYMFYGTDFHLADLPLPRDYLNEDWSLLHEESPKNNYFFAFDSVMKLFNHTATFKRKSDLTLITQYLTSIDDIESKEFLVDTKEKNRMQKEEGFAPIAYIQSDCVTPSDRDIYVKALMKHIKVDSYGKCLKNKNLPQHLSEAVRSFDSKEFYKIIANYKFVFAMENAICEDYITEKFWRSFYIGSVPITYGSPKLKELVPDVNTTIDIQDFDSPESLASFINKLNNDDPEYEKYLKYKRKNGVKNPILLELMAKRKWGINNDRIKGSYIDSFECLVCERLHENLKRKRKQEPLISYVSNKEAYGCPIPYTFDENGILHDEKYAANNPKSKRIDSSFKFSYEYAYFQQKIIIENFLSRNFSNYTKKQIEKAALNMHREMFFKNNHFKIEEL